MLSGRPGKDHKVLIVKLDNTVNSDPHAGLLAADVVYLEEVEYGLTRYMAVYSSRYPKRIGPIRSARISDLEIVRQYGTHRVCLLRGAKSNPGRHRPSLLIPRQQRRRGGWITVATRHVPRPWDLFGDPKQLLTNAPKSHQGQGRRVHLR